MINSRSIDDLTLDAQAWFKRFVMKVEDEAGMIYGHDWIVTSTYRDQECQDKLFAQGRSDPGPVVTWTRYSRHTGRRAWDIAIRDNKTGKLSWDIKVDVNHDNMPDYQQLALLGKSMGLNCGYFWAKRDAAHFELPETVG